jgi:putative transposase
MEYRRSRVPGATYFFTVVTYQRQPLFGELDNVELLREVFREVKATLPFEIEAMVVLPDHLHCLWTLPEGDADFSERWRRIKGKFSRQCAVRYQQTVSASCSSKGEKAVWQRRFWEHQIRNEADFQSHVEYIHYNPVKHGLVATPKDWPHSSFHKYVRNGIYPEDWGSEVTPKFDENIGKE